MRQVLNNPWVVLALSAVAVLILYLNYEEVSVNHAETPQMSMPQSLSAAGSGFENMAHSQADHVQLSWPETFARDPFAPHDDSGSKLPQPGRQRSGHQSVNERVVSRLPPLQLTAIMLNPRPKRAVINRKIVAEGDRIEGFPVSRIESDGVWIDGPAGPHHVVFGLEHNEKTTKNRNMNVQSKSPRQTMGSRQLQEDT